MAGECIATSGRLQNNPASSGVSYGTSLADLLFVSINNLYTFEPWPLNM
jgi:hypothetical protein